MSNQNRRAAEVLDLIERLEPAIGNYRRGWGPWDIDGMKRALAFREAEKYAEKYANPVVAK